MTHEFCNSHYVSHFAAFFIDVGAETSTVTSCKVVFLFLKLYGFFFFRLCAEKLDQVLKKNKNKNASGPFFFFFSFFLSSIVSFARGVYGIFFFFFFPPSSPLPSRKREKRKEEEEEKIISLDNLKEC